MTTTSEECFLCDQILKPKTTLKKKEKLHIPAAIERYLAFGKSLCMLNPKTRLTDGSYRASIGPRLQRQWDYVVEHSRTVYNRHAIDAAADSDTQYEVYPSMSSEMLERHFLDHVDDADIQNARNRIFMADACRRKRETVEKLWEKAQGEEDENGMLPDDAQKEHMKDYMQYQKMYASMAHESTSRKSSDEP